MRRPPKHREREAAFFYTPLDRRLRVAGYAVKGDSFVAGKPYVWSQKSLMVARVGSPFDLAPNGKRFAVALYPDGTAEPKPIRHITVLENFFDELRRRVPAGGR